MSGFLTRALGLRPGAPLLAPSPSDVPRVLGTTPATPPAVLGSGDASRMRRKLKPGAGKRAKAPAGVLTGGGY